MLVFFTFGGNIKLLLLVEISLNESQVPLKLKSMSRYLKYKQRAVNQCRAGNISNEMLAANGKPSVQQ